jgi:hypothetical protein
MKIPFFTAVVLGCLSLGCRTPQFTREHDARTAVAAVLNEHQFAPATTLPAETGITYYVAARPGQQRFIEMIVVTVRDKADVSADIRTYQYISSDWATVGRLFTDGRPEREAAAIEQAIKERLR